MPNISDPSVPRTHSPWRKSSHSYGAGECVELARLDGGRIGLRDSKDPGGPVLRFTVAEVAAFVAAVKAGEFDDLV
ncbi:MAG TPA: DUF397 domain-containing protein [Acidimicrobiales bacterium]|nr:DUF397 domain-containing protein [Acidimicrobiales bacterium]